MHVARALACAAGGLARSHRALPLDERSFRPSVSLRAAGVLLGEPRGLFECRSYPHE
jgi:hypothetical protein